MSFAVSAQPEVGRDVPAYLGETRSGERATGEDTHNLGEKWLAYRSDLKDRWELCNEPRHTDPDAAVTINESGLRAFSMLNTSLQHLMASTVREDIFGPMVPSVSAVKAAVRAIFPLVQFGYRLPEASDVDVDHDGDLRVVWENDTRSLEIVFPHRADAAPYIYHSEGDQYAVERDLSFGNLKKWLDWLRA